MSTAPPRPSRTPGRYDRALDTVADNSLLVVLLAFLAAVLLSIADVLVVGDSWMTLVAGREIAEHGLPSREALTAIPLGREWVDQQWLAQLALHGAEALGGLRLALGLGVALVVLAFGSAVAAARLRGASARSTLFVAVAAILVAPLAWQLRAQSLALPLFVWTLALVAADLRLERRRTLLAVPLLAVWANVHGSVVLGAAMVSLAGGLALGARAVGRSGTPVWRGLACLLAPWALLLASPYALDLPGYYRLMLLDSPISKVIAEWQAPEPEGWALGFFAFAVLAAVVAVWKRRRLTLFDLLVLAAMLAVALRSGRGIVWFALAATVLLPRALDGLLPGEPAPTRRRLGLALAGAFAGMAAVALVAFAIRPADDLERAWPREAVAALVAAAAGEGPRAVFPSDRHADWLLWTAPGLRGRVAYDIRFELLTARELASLLRYKGLRPGWERALDGYRVVVLDPSDTPRHRAALEARGARVIHADDEIVVLLMP